MQIQCEENFKTLLEQRQLDLDKKKGISFLERTIRHHIAYIKFNIYGIKISIILSLKLDELILKIIQKDKFKKSQENTAKEKVSDPIDTKNIL